MDISKIERGNNIFLFELDDVLFPKSDYLIQVYYLFASFYEFAEGTIKANDMAVFMKKIYEHHGDEAVFTSVQTLYGVDDKYLDNLERLKANAQLPVRLELFHPVEQLIKELIDEGKQIGILTKGNPVAQLNKIKFMNWGLLETYRDSMKIYFYDELIYRGLDPIDYIALEFNVNASDILYIDKKT